MSQASEWFFLDEPERSLVAEAMDLVASRSAREAGQLRQSFEVLARAGAMIAASPAISPSAPNGRRSAETLIELLCRVPDYDLDLHLPTKAVLGQGFLIAKINFLKALGYAVAAVGEHGELHERLAYEVSQSVYSKLAEELFISIVTDPDGDREVKARAARFLFRVWEDRLSLEVDDFAPVLESVWRARNKVRPVLGTLRGTSEIFRIFREAEGDEFLRYFGDDDLPEEQSLAFEEFLFGLSHEEIQTLRDHLDACSARVISSEQAQQVLGRGRSSWAPPTDGPQALYTSYKKRRLKAHYRTLTGTPGPKKTAEEYLMVAFLRRGLLDPESSR